jgi:deoxyribodipyrimidine photo-lyase
MQEINIIWFRRDLRLFDNHALSQIIHDKGKNIYPIFIFDTEITSKLPKNDPRLNFIYDLLNEMQNTFKAFDTNLNISKGKPLDIFTKLSEKFTIRSIYCNEDYESYGMERDQLISNFAIQKGIEFKSFQDHLIKKPGSVVKKDGSPYQIYTPFKKQYLKSLSKFELLEHPVELEKGQFYSQESTFPSLNDIDLEESRIKVPSINNDLDDYEENRNFPGLDKTSKLGAHLRFGSISIRQLFKAHQENDVFISELIWREFFIHILFFFPDSANHCFKSKYEAVLWNNNQDDFKKWCNGLTGFPMVDAGMRELNTTGFMHNRVRMIVASFLCKHLLIDWRWGERYFAEKLFDFELASNVGNWQWAAGTGCDAAPYFRVFNPSSQHQKFDPSSDYVNKWVPEWNDLNYRPMINHDFARKRAINTYKNALQDNL